jgi:hypothetical protein
MSKTDVAGVSFLAGLMSATTLTLLVKPGFLMDLWNVLLTMSIVALVYALAAYGRTLAFKPRTILHDQPADVQEGPAEEERFGHDVIRGATSTSGPIGMDEVMGATGAYGPEPTPEEPVCICPAHHYVHPDCPIHGRGPQPRRIAAPPGELRPGSLAARHAGCTCPTPFGHDPVPARDAHCPLHADPGDAEELNQLLNQLRSLPPGSAEAILNGCLCMGMSDGRTVIAPRCPYHGDTERKEQEPKTNLWDHLSEEFQEK